jgi:hypothetical protein
MKVVDARLSSGEVITITEKSFVERIATRQGWMDYERPFEASFGGGMTALVNPKFIVWARVMERA